MKESGSKSPLLLYLLLYQVAPQESPVPSSTPSQAQIIEQRTPAELHNPSWEGDLPGLGLIAKPDQDFGKSLTKSGVVRGGFECAILPTSEEQLNCPGMTSEQFLISSCVIITIDTVQKILGCKFYQNKVQHLRWTPHECLEFQTDGSLSCVVCLTNSLGNARSW